MDNNDRDPLGSNSGWFPIKIYYLLWIALLRSEDHGLVNLRYESTYVIVKKAALAFGNNGEQIGQNFCLILGEDIRICNFVLTALDHNLHLFEVTIDSSSSSSTNDSSLYHQISTVKGRSLGTTIMVNKPRYYRYGEQWVMQNFVTSERDYHEMQLAGKGGGVINHPGIVKGDEAVRLSRTRTQ